MSNRDLQDVEREIRSWTARPPERSPRLARTRVLARLEDRRRPWHSWRYAAAASALVAVLVAGLLVLGPTDEPPAPPMVAAAEQPSSGLLVFELKSGTKLYLALAPPSAEPAAKNL